MTAKEQLLEIFNAGLAAVKPGEAVLRHLKLVGDTLIADGNKYDLSKGRLFVVGAGKGAAPMAQAIEALLGKYIERGIVVVKYEHGLDLDRLEIAEASHPVPDCAGEDAAKQIAALATEPGPEDLLLCLFTGGASALLPAPAHGLNLADLQATTSLLLASGASIDEINAIRKHLSRLSGGQLARIAKSRILAVIVSDVIGDDLSSIASGPTAPDRFTFADCLAIINRYGIAGDLPKTVLKVLEGGASGKLPDTPKPEDPVFKRVQNLIIASNGQALRAAADKAASLGFKTEIEDEPLTGEAREVAEILVAKAKRIAAKLLPGDKPVCLLAGGETTVTIKGSGLGGRNQEMALAASLALEGEGRIYALFAGTDGTDGPTNAAGGFATPETAKKLGTRASDMLNNNDSNKALRETGDLLITGPTRTNVMDLAIILIEPPLA